MNFGHELALEFYLARNNVDLAQGHIFDPVSDVKLLAAVKLALDRRIADLDPDVVAFDARNHTVELLADLGTWPPGLNPSAAGTS